MYYTRDERISLEEILSQYGEKLSNYLKNETHRTATAYESQKKYFKTDKGKEARRRAARKYYLKKKLLKKHL